MRKVNKIQNQNKQIKHYHKSLEWMFPLIHFFPKYDRNFQILRAIFTDAFLFNVIFQKQNYLVRSLI